MVGDFKSSPGSQAEGIKHSTLWQNILCGSLLFDIFLGGGGLWAVGVTVLL